jgi:hypothetical protein
MRVVVAPVDEFRPGDRRIVTIGGRSIGVFRVGDRFYGIRNRCPHQGGPLCKGPVSPWARSSGPGDFQLEGGRRCWPVRGTAGSTTWPPDSRSCSLLSRG